MGAIHIHPLPFTRLPTKPCKLQKKKKKKKSRTNPKPDDILRASERSYLLLLQRTPTITLIERKMFLLHLTRQLAAFRSCCPKPAPAGCPAAKEGGRGVLLLSQGSLGSFRREREAAAGQRAGGTWGTAGGLERSCSWPPIAERFSWCSFILQKPQQGDFPPPNHPSVPFPVLEGVRASPGTGTRRGVGHGRVFFGKRSLKTEKVGGGSGHGAKSTPKLPGFAGVIPWLHHSQPADAS